MSLNKTPKLILVDAAFSKKKIKMQMSMTFQEKKVTRHVGEWILNTYSPTANFGRIGEWASGYPQHWSWTNCMLFAFLYLFNFIDMLHLEFSGKDF